MSKCLIVYYSYHHKNTEKIARRMAGAVKADICSVEELSKYDISGYDIIGFGSGIAYSKHYKELENAITDIDLTDKKVFVFSTSGSGNNDNNKTLCDIIKIKGGEIAGSFNCRGYDTYGPFKLVGGIAKGHPNENDFAEAEDFIKEICAE